ncbi:MAG: HAD family hydrolase, partial [Chloroflexota bacterium]
MTGLARFLHRAGALKFVPRTGWLHRGVPAAEVESVADHSW